MKNGVLLHWMARCLLHKYFSEKLGIKMECMKGGNIGQGRKVLLKEEDQS